MLGKMFVSVVRAFTLILIAAWGFSNYWLKQNLTCGAIHILTAERWQRKMYTSTTKAEPNDTCNIGGFPCSMKLGGARNYSRDL